MKMQILQCYNGFQHLYCCQTSFDSKINQAQVEGGESGVNRARGPSQVQIPVSSWVPWRQLAHHHPWYWGQHVIGFGRPCILSLPI